jgi:hypothetical protein
LFCPKERFWKDNQGIKTRYLIDKTSHGSTIKISALTKLRAPGQPGLQSENLPQKNNKKNNNKNVAYFLYSARKS